MTTTTRESTRATGSFEAPAAAPSEARNAPPAVPRRSVAASTWRVFGAWTVFFWGASGLFAVLFYVGVLDFTTSTKASLYGIGIWLNGWSIPWLLPSARSRPKSEIWHECLVLWMVSYAMTNVLWEIPWVVFSPFVFDGLHTLDDVVARTAWMRESASHMYWWVLASFSSVDLRTVDHDPTFYTLELYAFVNVAAVVWFFRLDARRSALRYLVPVLGTGEPVAATFIFSVSEVFAGFEHMSGGFADTLLALVWTQYQYFVFPLVFGLVGAKLLLEDWRQTHATPVEGDRR